MKNEAITAGSATAAGTFTHTPRPAIVPDSRPDERYFGADSLTETCGIKNNNGRSDATASVGVERIGHMPGAARLSVDSWVIEGTSFSTTIKLSPAQLRELARCLIDAAADIEAEGAAQ